MPERSYDLLVSGGTVVTPGGAEVLDVAIAGEVIAAIGLPGAFRATRTIDATDCIVMPGGVDPHVHFHLNLPDLEGNLIPDEDQEYSFAAAMGGTTTIVDFAKWERLEWDKSREHSLRAAIDAKKAEAAGRMAVDYGLHALITGNPPFEVLEEIGTVIANGIPTIKTASSCPPWTSDDGHRLGVMLEVSRHGGLHILHAEDQEIINWMTEKYAREGKVHGAYTAETRGALVEEAAIRRAILLAERTGCPLYVFHVAAESGAQAIREARARGSAVFAETLPCYLSFTSEKLWDDEHQGLLWTNWPSIKEESDRSGIWNAICDNTIQVVSSDHYVVLKDDRYRGMGHTVHTGGQAGQAALEMRVPLLYSEGVHKRRISLARFVELVATNPAVISGLYPRKGVILPGSDADLTILDPNKNWTVRTEEHHMSADYNCWNGWNLHGKVRDTILRGTPVVLAEEWVGDTAGGQYLERRFQGGFLESLQAQAPQWPLTHQVGRPINAGVTA